MRGYEIVNHVEKLNLLKDALSKYPDYRDFTDHGIAKVINNHFLKNSVKIIKKKGGKP